MRAGQGQNRVRVLGRTAIFNSVSVSIQALFFKKSLCFPSGGFGGGGEIKCQNFNRIDGMVFEWALLQGCGSSSHWSSIS